MSTHLVEIIKISSVDDYERESFQIGGEIGFSANSNFFFCLQLLLAEKAEAHPFFTSLHILSNRTADKFGRRMAMTMECVVFSIGVLIQVTAFQAWYQIAIGRLVTGLGVGALSAAVP